MDDFHRIGDKNSNEWLDIMHKVDQAYKWGTVKMRSYRHAGTDVETMNADDGTFNISVSQDAYIETIHRLRQNGPLSPYEVGACRTSLGAMQWLAAQTQPQICARCNLLLTEVVTNGTLETARKIQQMIGEVRRESYNLEFHKVPTAEHWSDLIVRKGTALAA